MSQHDTEKRRQETYLLRGWAEELVSYAERRADKHGLPFLLTVRDVQRLWDQQQGLCFWYGVPLLRTSRSKHPQQPSLDRLDNSQGYTVGNVVLTSLAANLGRNTATVEDFAVFCDNIRTTIPDAPRSFPSP